MHSLYTLHRYETSYYSWLHQRGQAYPAEFPDVNRTKLYVVNQGPSFARKEFGTPLLFRNPDYTSYYLEAISKLETAQLRPEYVLVPERFYDCAGQQYCSQATQHGILNMKAKTKDDREEKMYELEKTFYSEVIADSPRT